MEIVKSIKYGNKVFADRESLVQHIAISYISKLQSAAQKGNADKINSLIKSAYDDVIELEDLDI
jgi:hypothetical protein